MDEAKLKALLEEATTHCYDDEEAFWGMFCTLQMRLSFPLQASVGGETATLVGVDEPSSGLEQGVMVRIQKEGQEKTVALTDLEPVDPDPASGEWLAVYRYWLRKARRG
ncbi:MAG: calcium-binding protein [Anaerolineae bacterium]